MLLVVVVAIVLLLTARSWNAVAPTAAEVRNATDPVPTDIREAATAATRSGSMPGLDDLRQSTDAHAEDVKDALAQAD